MDFHETAISLFNESDSYFQLLVFEKQDRNIYGTSNKNLIVGKLKDINYKIVIVEGITMIDSEYYYKINYINKIKGYFKPEDSIVIIPKNKEQVKLNSEVKFNNEINRHLSLNDKLFEEVINKIAYSSSYAIYNDKVFEVVVYKNEIVGFFPSIQLEHLIRYSTEFSINENTVVYKDSSLQKELLTIEDGKNKYKSDFVIPTSNSVRFKNNGTICWVSLSSTDINYNKPIFKPNNGSETLLKSIIYQYKDKLQKSHSYSLKIMKQEINKIKG